MGEAEHCQIPNVVEKLFAASHCSVGFLGGSLTTGVGASNTAVASWRALFTEHLYRNYHPKYHCQVSEVMGAVGACESYAAAFTLGRNVIPAKPDLAIVEFCVNDRGAPDKNLVLKGMEGIVRQLVTADHRCNVIILGMGVRENDVDHSLHRQIAEHYDLPFVDVQSYMFARLKERRQTWDDASIEFVEKDSCHLNDYGNRLAFEALRDCFEDQAARFLAGRKTDRDAPVPEPLVSDEFQFARQIDPSKRNKAIRLEGEWETKDQGHVPWYFDNLLVGHPGASLTFTFEGTAASVFGLMFNNGLKLEAELDGRELPGLYLRHFIEFGKGLVLAHGLPQAEHVLKLTVGKPSKRHNKLANPTAQIGSLGVASKPAG